MAILLQVETVVLTAAPTPIDFHAVDRPSTQSPPMKTSFDSLHRATRGTRGVVVACLLAVLCTALLAGCADVHAYQRGRLAHPSMDPAYAASVGQEHVEAVHEGATGGHVGSTSGCGCN